jgi:LysR family glycine cleavage system transcriptional activator
MKRTHLPLNALRVFDAAARHLSFTRAADELAVTPAAVGQQIRALEDLLGVVLFRRTTKGLELTDEAQAGWSLCAPVSCNLKMRCRRCRRGNPRMFIRLPPRVIFSRHGWPRVWPRSGPPIPTSASFWSMATPPISPRPISIWRCAFRRSG